MKDKNVAGILALFLGGLGVHKFYLGQTGMGILYILFCWTWIPVIVSLIEGIVFLASSKEAFDAKYNRGLLPAPAAAAVAPSVAAPQNIVVNVANTAQANGGDVVERIKSLYELKQSGALSEEEYADQKRKLLGAG